MRFKLTFYHRVVPVRGVAFRDASPDKPHALIVEGPLRLTAIGCVMSHANIDNDSGRFIAVRAEKRSRRRSDYAFSVPGSGCFRSLFIEAMPDK